MGDTFFHVFAFSFWIYGVLLLSGYRGSYTGAPLLLNLLKELIKSNTINKFNKTGSLWLMYL